MNKQMFAGGLSLGIVLGLVLAIVIIEIVAPPITQRHPTINHLDTNEHTRVSPDLEYTAPEVLVLSPTRGWPDTVRSATRNNGVWRYLGGGKYIWKENSK